MPHRACSRRRRLYQGLGSALRRGVPKGPLANRHTSRALDSERCSEARGPQRPPTNRHTSPKAAACISEPVQQQPEPGRPPSLVGQQ